MIAESFSSLIYGFGILADPSNILYMVIGVTLGVLIGVLPGLGGANGVAILLPLTFTMSPTAAIIMLSSIYWGALFGGAITSILFNIPGEPWSVATTFDGHPMAVQFLGLYVASFGLIAAFMRMVGRIALWKSLLTAFLFTAIMFVTFDVAFDVIMPKGPLEAFLGR